MTTKVELFTPAERTRRNARMARAWGELIGVLLLGVPCALIAGVCAVREAWSLPSVKENNHDD